MGLRGLNEELAIARCELSQQQWKGFSPCAAMEEDAPARFSAAVAEHFTKTELGLSLTSLPLTCRRGSAFCDVKFSNGGLSALLSFDF